MSQHNLSPLSHSISSRRAGRRATRRATAMAAVSLLASAQTSAFDLNNSMTNAEKAFSATQTITSGKNGRDSLSTQVYREGQKIRMDISEGNQNMSVVMRLDNETNFMLMHDMKMYQEVKSKRIKQYQNNMGMVFSNQQTIGRETVNGYKTTKYTADYKDNDGQTGSGTFWVTDDEIVVRAEMQLQQRRKVQETSMNLTNLKVADQPDELFEVPAGYNSLGLGSLFSDAMRQSRGNAPVSDQERAEQAPEDQATEDQGPEAAAEPEESKGKRARKALGKLFGGSNG